MHHEQRWTSGWSRPDGARRWNRGTPFPAFSRPREPFQAGSRLAHCPQLFSQLFPHAEHDRTRERGLPIRDPALESGQFDFLKLPYDFRQVRRLICRAFQNPECI
jgi:hypothetical protein